jgi:FtsP/CotA-like multicopper oxidase with cupredoxin domain
VGHSSILLHDGEAARPIARLIPSDEPSIQKNAVPPPAALPSNGLPLRLDLKTAVRADLVFASDQAVWVRPLAFTTDSRPAFNAKLGRAVVLSLTNRAASTAVFHLHGHHFRLLDRLDDGWKPFWLDTIAIDAGQSQRIAFVAEFAGRWLIEAAETRWEAPRLMRWYAVE